MSQRSVLIGILMLAVCAGLAAWWFNTFERVEQDVPAPLRGEARYNPLYALKKVLEARGIATAARADLNLKAMALEEGDTLVLSADVRTLSKDQVDDLLDWVEDGGHLIFALPPAGEGRGGELLTALGLSPVSRWLCLKWPEQGNGERNCFSTAFKIAAGSKQTDADKQFELLIGDGAQGYVLGRHARGDGAWLAAGNLRFLYNRELNAAGNIAFAWQVLAPMLRGGKVHLVYAADVPPLQVLLVRYGWPALLPALIALLAWLAARSQRFGPLLPLAPARRRALREHVHAAGEFIFRRGRAMALYAPLRRAFDEALRRDDPALAALDDGALISALAKQRGRSEAEVRLALQPVDLERPEHFTATITLLQKLRTRR